MEVLYSRCAGLDVHKDTVVAAVRVAVEERVTKEVRTFGTTTRQLLELASWLASFDCTHVAMEATGVYWKPVWHVLEDQFELVLANARHIRNVPGRKTDVNDATWIADLLAHGLIRGSFVPPAPIQELRGLTRTRKQLVREMAQHTQRIQKTLEDSNIKLASVVSDILGTSARAILEALIAGEDDPEKLLQGRDHRLQAKHEVLVESLRGRATAHHRFLLQLHLKQIDSLSQAVRELEARMGDALAPFRAQVELLKSMPGVSDVVAQVIAAEVGLDMSRFPTAAHLISWAGLCPRLDESAGRRGSTRTRNGAPWLKATLVQAAWSATRKKNSYLQALYWRIRGRRGHKKAVIAVAASMLNAAYYMLLDGAPYQDLGPQHFNRLNQGKTAQRLVRRLQDLGFQVEIKPAA